jgi:hypothetical protein
MRGTTTAGRLDKGNAASSSAAMRAIEQSDGSAANGGARDRTWLRRNLPGRRIRSDGVGNPGNVGSKEKSRAYSLDVSKIAYRIAVDTR